MQMNDVLSSAIFWIGLIQWATLFPFVLVSQYFLVSRTSLFIETTLEILVLVVVAGVVLFVPLYASGYLPLPSGYELSSYKYGFVLGALLSIPIREFLKRHLRSMGSDSIDSGTNE